MATLKIHGFSCIYEAEVKLGQLTILVGPQASGKSVISKLIYFSNNILNQQFIAIEADKSVAAFSNQLAEDFKKWFPPGAWGKTRFTITYEAGEFSVRIMRKLSRGKPADGVSIKFSPFFQREYESLLESYRSAADSAVSARESEDFDIHRQFDLMLSLRSKARRLFLKAFDGEYIEFQTFIPAGRSFFTSIGKAVAAFEYGGILDPVTVRFGRLYTSLRERMVQRFAAPTTLEQKGVRRDLMRQIFGGELRSNRDEEYVEADDGRKIPFSVLSSGQQELLPLWLALESTARQRVQIGKRLVYIEEPEAHLFPSAQSLLVEYLASIVAASAGGRWMLITTHSPYVLAKFNNLMKAGALGSQTAKGRAAQVEGIVPRECWLRSRNVKAFALMDGAVRDIMGKDGLIDAEYLDEVSTEISNEFSRLLEVEYAR